MRVSVYVETYNNDNWNLKTSYNLEFNDNKKFIPYLFNGNGNEPTRLFYKNEEWNIVGVIRPLFKETILPVDCFLSNLIIDVFEYIDTEKFVVIPDRKAITLTLEQIENINWDDIITLSIEKEVPKEGRKDNEFTKLEIKVYEDHVENVKIKEILLIFYHLCKKLKQDYLSFNNNFVRIIIFS